MNKTVQTTALAVLIAAAPMIGTAAPRKAPAAKAAKPAAPAAASPLSEAWTALTNELNESMEGGDMVFRLDKVYGKPLSAPTQAKLKRVFGDTDPATLTRQANAAGGFDYRFTLVPFRYVDADGGALNWTELVATESIDAAQSQISGAFKWERLDYKAKGLNITVNGVNGVGEQSRSGGDTWTGKGSGRVESIVFDDPSKPGLAPRMEAITYEASSTARGKLVDGAFTMNIARIAMLGEQIDDTRFTMHMNGMDMETFKAISKHQKAEKPEKGKELEALLPSLQALARSARTNNTSIQIDDISLGFHGHRVAISGSLAVAPGIDADFDTLAGIGRKVDAHFTVKVPTALILEISTLMARKQSAASNPSAPVNEAATAQMAQGMRDMVVGKMIGEGYARLEGETLVADLDIKEGTFSVNGKAIELPKGGAKPAAAAPAKAPAKKK